MKFAEIRDRIVNNPGLNSLEEIRKAGYRVVKERDGGRYFLVKREELKPLLVRLGDIAEVRRGFTTGANEFFYLEPTGKPAPKGLMHVRNGAGWEGFIEEEFLKPVIKSPREVKTIVVRPEDLKYKVFMCHQSKKELKGTYALEYIRWGENQNYHERPTCRGRPRWWDLGEWDYPMLFWADAYNNRYIVSLNSGNYYGDKRFFFINLKDDPFLLTAYLNSMITPLFIELQGIANLGQGVIYTNVYWLKTYPVLANLSFIIPVQQERLLSAFKQLSQCETYSIFEELGLPKPNRDYSNISPEHVSLNKVMPDRRELDRIIFEALGLTEGEQLAVYRAVVELVKNRLVKARSV